MKAPDVAEWPWYKSSYSNDQGGSCVEVANLTECIGIRDSKVKTGPALVVPTASWAAFIDLVRSGEADQGLID